MSANFAHSVNTQAKLPPTVFARYRELQQYVGWTAEDESRLTTAAPVAQPHFAPLVDDFYAEIRRHPVALAVITGGPDQIGRLKRTLRDWLGELFGGRYDETYVARQWRIGLRHVEIGLPQVYAEASLSRLRTGMVRALSSDWKDGPAALADCLQSLHKLIDLNLAIMSDAYETAYVERQTIAERRRLDDVLHREKELSAGLLAHAQAAVLILDRSGCMVRCNPFAQSLLGECSDVANEGQDWFELFLGSQDRARMRKALLEPPTSPEPQARATSIIERDGRRRQLHWAGVPLYDGTGQVFGVLVIGHDITDLYEAQQRALQAERLAAIGEMATGLAHESRNALQRIGASAEMLELELEGNPTGLQYVQRIDQAKNHLNHLLEEVRNYAAPIILDRSAIRISETWREAWQLLHLQRQGRDCRLQEHIEAEELLVDVDRFRMVQVFRNLLDNALAAAGDPAIIDIWCEEAVFEARRALRIRVCDNGPGLTAEQRRRIFEPFYTTKPTGTGLGTAIAQRLVAAHGGRLTAGDSGAAGAEIVLEIPVSSG